MLTEQLMLKKSLIEEPLGTTAGAGSVGAGLGAAVGATGSVAMWAKKRISLNKKLKACKDDECRKKVKNQIKLLRKRALRYGAAATVAGAGIGAAAGHSLHTANLYNHGAELAGQGRKISKGLGVAGVIGAASRMSRRIDKLEDKK